jgi:hypothetical protein
VTIFEPMDLTMELHEDGEESPNPPYDREWSRIDAPLWRTGIIKARTGIEDRFNYQYTARGPEHSHENPTLIEMNLNALAWTSVCSAFDSEMDTYLRGLEVGAGAGQRS